MFVYRICSRACVLFMCVCVCVCARTLFNLYRTVTIIRLYFSKFNRSAVINFNDPPFNLMLKCCCECSEVHT